MFPTSTANGKTRVYVGPETNVDGTSVTGTATSASDSTAYSKVTQISLGGGTGIKAQSILTEDTDAFIGDKSHVTLVGSASLTATSNGTSTAHVEGFSAGGIEISLYDVTASTNMHTGAFVGDGSTFSGTSLALSATGTANPVIDFKSTTIALGGGGGASITATDTSTVESYIGPASGTATTTITTTSAVTGVSASATANSTVTPTSDMASIGLLASVGATSTTATSNPTAKSYLGNHGAIVANNNGAADFEATTNAVGRANSSGFGGGAFSYQGASATTTVNPTAKATTVGGGSITAGNVTFRAQLNPGGSSNSCTGAAGAAVTCITLGVIHQRDESGGIESAARGIEQNL